jgi:hypothetical protein
VPARRGAIGEFSHEPRLADPRFARHLDRARTASIQLIEAPLEHAELVGPADKVPGKQSDTPCRARSAGTGSFEATRSRRHSHHLLH